MFFVKKYKKYSFLYSMRISTMCVVACILLSTFIIIWYIGIYTPLDNSATWYAAQTAYMQKEHTPAHKGDGSAFLVTQKKNIFGLQKKCNQSTVHQRLDNLMSSAQKNAIVIRQAKQIETKIEKSYTILSYAINATGDFQKIIQWIDSIVVEECGIYIRKYSLSKTITSEKNSTNLITIDIVIGMYIF